MDPLTLGAQISGPSISLEVPLRVDVELVTLSISVRDRNRQFIDNLRKEDFSLSEDGIPCPITYFEAENAPLSVVVLMDLSNSTKPHIDHMKLAASYIRDLLDSHDQAAVVVFSNYPWLLREFSAGPGLLPMLLESTFWNISGATNIYDSVYLASRKLCELPPERRRLIILISDGQGNRGEQDRALGELKRSRATLLGINIGASPLVKRAIGTFRELSKVSGGKVFRFGPDLRQELQSTLQRVRSGYVVGFAPGHAKLGEHVPQLSLGISRESPMASLGLVLEGRTNFSTPTNPGPAN